MSCYQPDDSVVVMGYGVGRVVSADDAQVVVRLMKDEEVTVKLAEARHLLRAIATRMQADQLLKRLCEPCTEERSLPATRSLREFRRETIERQVEYLRWYFRREEALYPNEAKIVLVGIENVLAELAVSLDVNVSDLRAAIERGNPEVEPRDESVLTESPLVQERKFASRTIYEGTISVENSDYVETESKGDDIVDVPIGRLDEPVTRKAQLRFVLDYPFEKSYEGVVTSDVGPTLRQIIDAIRRGYREMYEGASEAELPNSYNRLVRGDYGIAGHAIGDLVIASIDLDEEAGTLDINIES